MLFVRRVDSAVDHLVISLSNDEVVSRSFVWLRDHARDASSFDHETHQRLVQSGAIDPEVQPQWVGIRQGQLQLRWGDAGMVATGAINFSHLVVSFT